MTGPESLFSPVQLAAFIGIAAFLLSIYVNVLKARRLTRLEPGNAELSTAFARLAALVEQHDRGLRKLEDECAACRRYQSAEIGKVHNRVDDVAGLCARLDGKMDMLLNRKACSHG
ncbi:MAG TPA: hypothetical protein P5026_05570 [Kiritimatiellia bacterium]|nr:hypothetical protein [Kiritimatiellia bacterium]